jgi:hypothetical protein
MTVLIVFQPQLIGLSTDKLGGARGHKLVFSPNLPRCFGWYVWWGKAWANLNLPRQASPDVFNHFSRLV